MQMFSQRARSTGAGSFSQAPSVAMRGGETDQRVDIHGLYLIIRRRMPLIAAITSIMVAIAIAYLMSATRMYSSSVQILIDPRQKIIVGSQVRAGGLGFDKAMIASQVSIISSDTVLRRVVKKFRLSSDPEFIGKPGLRDRLKTMLGMAAKPKGSGNLEDRALETLYKRLSVKRANMTYVIEVTVSSENPEKAARLAQAVADAYLADQSDAKIQTTRQTSRLLAERLDELRDRVRDVETQIEKFKIKHNIVAAEGKLVNEQRLNRLNDQLINARSATAQSLARYNKVKSFLRSGVDLDSTYEAVNSALIARLRTQYAEIARRQSNLKASLGASHPSLISVNAQLRQTKNLIREELSRIAKTARNEYEIALAREKSILKNLEDSKIQASLSNEARIKLRELQREATARRAIFQSFLVRARETKEQENLQTADARIISAAAIPISPSHPRKKLILVMAFIAGLGLGILVALSVELFSKKNAGIAPADSPEGGRAGGDVPVSRSFIQDSGGQYAVNQASQPVMRQGVARQGVARQGIPPQSVPVPEPVAYIPRLEWRDGAGWPMTGDKSGGAALRDFAMALDDPGYLPPSAFSVAVHGLLNTLQMSLVEGAGRKVLLCAPGTGEGVSTLAFSLAVTALLADNRALLVDADMTRPELSGKIGKGAPQGMVGDSSSYASMEQIVVRDEQTGIEFLPFAPPHGYERNFTAGDLLVQRMTRLVRNYSMVFIDGGSAAENAGLCDLVEHVDDVLMVVRDGAHNRAGIAHALNTLGVGVDKFRGVVNVMSSQSMSQAG